MFMTDLAMLYHAVYPVSKIERVPSLPAVSNIAQIFPQRAWTKNPNAGTPANIQERVKLVAQAGYEAAQKVLNMKHKDRTVDKAIDVFTNWKTAMLFYAETGRRAPSLVTLSREEAAITVASPEFKQFAELAEACQEIKEMLTANKEDIDPKRMQALREKISQALDGAYLIANQDTIFPRFLRLLSNQINTQAEAMSIVRDIGKDALETCGESAFENESEVDFKTLSQAIETVISNYPADNWDNPINYIFWALKNLARAILAWIDTKTSIFGYNSYALGNANMWMGDFEVNGKKVRFNLGPSPMNDSLFTAQLQLEKEQGIHRLQHTLECTHHAGELARLEKLRDLAKDKNNHLTVMGTPLDGEIWNGKGAFKKIDSVKDFHDKLRAELTKNSNCLPEKCLPDQMDQYRGFANPVLKPEEIEETIQASQAAFECLLPGTLSVLDEKQNERLSRAMLLGFTGFMVVKTLQKLPEWIEGESKDKTAKAVTESVIATMGQVCKQGVDRGPVTNATTLAFVKLIENGKLRGQDVQQITGTVLMRALMVDERLIVKSRLEALLDLFNLIGKKQDEFTEKLQSFAGKTEKKPNPINFITSQEVVTRAAQEMYKAAQL